MFIVTAVTKGLSDNAYHLVELICVLIGIGLVIAVKIHKEYPSGLKKFRSFLVQGWFPEFHFVILCFDFLAAVLIVGGVLIKLFRPEYPHLGRIILGVVAISIGFWWVGFIRNKKSKLLSATSPPQLTNELICYNFVSALKRHKVDYLRFKEVTTLLRRRGWPFSGDQTAIEILAEFGFQTGLLFVSSDMEKVFLTHLALHPGDRTLANMILAELRQIPEESKKDIYLGNSSSFDDLLEDITQLNERGLDYVREYRSTEEKTARKKKVS